MRSRDPDFQEKAMLRRAVENGGEVYVVTAVDHEIGLACLRQCWVTAHGRDPSRLVISDFGREVIGG